MFLPPRIVRRVFAVLRVCLFVVFAFVGYQPSAPASAAPTATIRYVAISGNDWGNGTCTQATPCRTIKYAIEVAAAGDTIDIGAGTFNEHNIRILKNLTLDGNGIRNTIVDGEAKNRVFQIGHDVTAEIKGMRIKNGKAKPSAYGGGVLNFGTLTLKKVALSDNEALIGGGVFNWGTLSMKRSVLYNNTGWGQGGGLGNAKDRSAVLNEVNVQRNAAGVGGGISNSGSLLLFHSAVHETLHGAAILNSGSAILLNVAISGNAHPGAVTGGVLVHAGSVELHYVTLSANAGQAIHIQSGSVGLYKSIVHNNASNPQCHTTGKGSYSDGGHNVLADTSCGYWSGSGSLIANAKLNPLAYNGGATPTHALKPASPAIDLVPINLCVPQDQRGVARPVDGDGIGKSKCDAGSFEYQP